jgi:formylglycine-generating enzyme required for sulfatase activity
MAAAGLQKTAQRETISSHQASRAQDLSRLFISHSSRDNVAAKAFKQWLCANDWPDEDVFLDLEDIGAGERWKDALRKANARCEAVVLLASPEALSSPECLAEVRKAEDYGKEIIVVLLRDVKFEDHRLDAYKDRQIVNLASPPQGHVEAVDYRGEKHEVRFNADALTSVRQYLAKRGITPDHFAWPPPDKPDAEPFPGLSAFTEEDAGIFFGRDSDILRGLDKLRITRRNGRPRGLVIQAASGAGKSSYLRAGLWPRLLRDADFAPLAILRPARGILTGPEGLGRKLAARLSRPDRPVNPGDIHAKLTAKDATKAAADFAELMTALASRAQEERRIGDKNAPAPALLLAIDQAEELFAAEGEEESRRFLLLLSAFLRQPPPGVEPYLILTIRADAAVRLFQTITDEELEFPETLPLLPLPRTSYREVILKPLQVLERRGQRLVLEAALTERLVGDATGADALPLLAFTLSHLYQEFAAGGTITLKQYEDMGGVAGSIEMALKRALARPGEEPAIPAGKDEQLARLRAAFIPWLARIDPQSGVAVRRVARMDEFPQPSLALVKRLIEARLLVADSRSGADVVEIAHESLLRQWPELTEWLKADAEDLQVVEEVERAAGEWAGKHKHADWLDHRGARLRAAERVATRADFRKRLGEQGLAYLEACRAAERKRTLKRAAMAGAVAVLIIAGAAAWKYQQNLREGLYWFADVRPYVLPPAREHALNPAEEFKECTDCPVMIVVPAGHFMMGSPEGQGEKSGREYPLHRVTIPSRFAVGKFPVTFAQWDACAEHGDCDPHVNTNGWGRDRQPVINVTWDDARRYVAWLARLTGTPYRLLSEAEYEYAARAGTQTAYPWGRDIGAGNANCGMCGSRWDGSQTAPVGSFPANRFGLYDMVGNVFEWVEDCYHDNYTGAPANGSPWTSANCLRHVVRGGAWLSHPNLLRAASRDWIGMGDRKDYVGFRVARTLGP